MSDIDRGDIASNTKQFVSLPVKVPERPQRASGSVAREN